MVSIKNFKEEKEEGGKEQKIKIGLHSPRLDHDLVRIGTVVKKSKSINIRFRFGPRKSKS